MDEVLVRPYEPADRSAVRKICCDTAHRGSPIENFFRDREVFADVVTRYYTDFEPQSAWVAASEAEVVGYLTGCLDTHRYRRIMRGRILPQAVARAILRGVLFHPESWRLLESAIMTWRVGGLHRGVSLEKYPAHMHINISSHFRSHQAGHHLGERFISQVKEARLFGIHLVTRSDNVSACQFFEKIGFTRLECSSVAFPEGKDILFHEAIIYGKEL